jgi:uncharacterized membrane protein HdeD (DUF308 family)
MANRFHPGLALALRTTVNGKGRHMIILGIILLVVGFIAKISILWTIGIILLVIGAILAIVGGTGRLVGGRKHWY